MRFCCRPLIHSKTFNLAISIVQVSVKKAPSATKIVSLMAGFGGLVQQVFCGAAGYVPKRRLTTANQLPYDSPRHILSSLGATPHDELLAEVDETGAACTRKTSPGPHEPA